MLQALCSLQTGAMLRQQRPDLFRQEFPEVAVDRQLAGQKPYRVLPFEAAQVRLVHEIAQYALQALRQGPGDFTRDGKVLRLGLVSWRPGRSGRRSLVDRHRKKERWRNSPSPLFAFRYAGSRPAGYDPWREEIALDNNTENDQAHEKQEEVTRVSVCLCATKERDGA